MADSQSEEAEGGQAKPTKSSQEMAESETESEVEDIYEVEKIVDMTRSKVSGRKRAL